MNQESGLVENNLVVLILIFDFFRLKLSLQGLAKGFRLARLPTDDDWE